MEPGPELEASVIIATYNRARVLAPVLEALGRQSVGPERFEVVVADDGSTDGTAELVAAVARRLPVHVSYVRLDHVGVCRARNEAIRCSRGRYLVFIDSDIVCDPRFVEEHLRTHHRHPRSVVTGPAVLIRSLDEIPRPVRPWHWSTAPFAGGNASVARDEALAAGLFDEGFDELGWEDVEFGIRLKARGLSVRFNPRAVGYHYKPDPVDPAALARYAAAQGRMAVRFVRKHPTLEVRMATGLNPVALLIDTLASVGDWDLRLARWVLDRTDPRREGWLRRLAAKQLYNRLYYKAARQALAELSGQAGSRTSPGEPA